MSSYGLTGLANKSTPIKPNFFTCSNLEYTWPQKNIHNLEISKNWTGKYYTYLASTCGALSLGMRRVMVVSLKCILLPAYNNQQDKCQMLKLGLNYLLWVYNNRFDIF